VPRRGYVSLQIPKYGKLIGRLHGKQNRRCVTPLAVPIRIVKTSHRESWIQKGMIIGHALPHNPTVIVSLVEDAPEDDTAGEQGVSPMLSKDSEQYSLMQNQTPCRIERM
jgi:hypothetical protein